MVGVEKMKTVNPTVGGDYLGTAAWYELEAKGVEFPFPKLFGRLGRKLQSLNVFRGELIRLEDPEFESHFVVYGSDQIEARYILSTSLMARITDFKEKTGKKIYLCSLNILWRSLIRN